MRGRCLQYDEFHTPGGIFYYCPPDVEFPEHLSSEMMRRSEDMANAEAYQALSRYLRAQSGLRADKERL